MSKIDHIYQNNILKPILKNGIKTNTIKYDTTDTVYIHPNAGYVSFCMDTKNSYPLISLRNCNIKLPIAETLWFISGIKDPSWLRKYTKMWDAFADEDGTVSCSYGYRWAHHFGRNQLDEAIEILSKDPSNRQAVIMTWDPCKDGLNTPRQKNVPCITMLQFTVVQNKLVLSVVWRSNDMYLGFPNDITGFTLLQHIIAQRLNLEVGQLNYTIHNAHLYENQIENATIIANTELNQEIANIKLELPKDIYKIARSKDQEAMDNIFEQIYSSIKSQYKPLQKLKRVKISI